ncbi:MAG: hypothetical protein ACLPSW_06195 [Roseiarcus sp.]
MTAFKASLAAVAVLAALCGGPAEANGRGGLTPQDVYAPGWQSGAPAIVGGMAWRTGGAALRSGSDLVAEAARYVGGGNPTGFHEAWCRDFVNMVLERTGHRLADKSHAAIAALNLGPRVDYPQPGDLAVMRGHVTIVASVDGAGGFVGLGGNQGHGRVTYSHFSMRSVVAFVRPS